MEVETLDSHACETTPQLSTSFGKAIAQPQAPTTALSSTIPVNPAPPQGQGLAAKLRKKRAAAVDSEKSSGHGERQQTVIPVRTPDSQWFFRCHHDPAMAVPVDVLIVKSGPDEGTYFLDPDVEFPDELDQYVVPAILTRSITNDGTEFFFLAKQSEKAPKESTRRVIREARKAWIKTKWNSVTKAYDFQYARQLRRAPVWSDKTLDELLEMAFGDKFITRPDHEIVNHLLYPDDSDFETAEPTDEE